MGSETLQSNGSYSFGETTTFTDTETAFGSYASYFAGSYSAGSYAFASVTLDEAGGDSYSLDVTDVTRDSGYSFESVTGTSHSAGTSSDGLRGKNGSDSVSYQYTDAGTLSSTDTLHVQSTGQDSSSWHAEGTYKFGAYSLSSMVARDGLAGTDTVSDAGTLAFDGNGTSSYTLQTSDASNVSFGLQRGVAAGTLTAQVSSSYAISVRATDSVTLVDSETASDYQAGVYAGGTYALSSVVSDAAGTSVYDDSGSATVVLDATESFAISGSGSSNETLALGGGGQGNTAAQGSFAWSGHDHATTTLVDSGSAHSVDTMSLHEVGSFANGSYSLGCVLYRDGGNASYMDHTQENDEADGAGVLTVASAGTFANSGTFTGGTSAGSTTSSGNAVYSYGYSGTTSLTDDSAGAGTYADYQAGQWAQGSYSLSSLPHSESGSAADTFSITCSPSRKARRYLRLNRWGNCLPVRGDDPSCSSGRTGSTGTRPTNSGRWPTGGQRGQGPTGDIAESSSTTARAVRQCV